MAKTIAQLKTQNTSVVKDNGGSNPNKTKGGPFRAHLADIIDKIEEVEQSIGEGDGEGGEGYEFAPVATVSEMVALPASLLTADKDLYSIKAGGKIFQLQRLSSAAIDEETIYQANTGLATGRWVLMSGNSGPVYSLTTGIWLRWPITVDNQNNSVFSLDDPSIVRVNGYQGALPDLTDSFIATMKIGGVDGVEGDQYIISSARQITLDLAVGEDLSGIDSIVINLIPDTSGTPTHAHEIAEIKGSAFNTVAVASAIRTLALAERYESFFEFDLAANATIQFSYTGSLGNRFAFLVITKTVAGDIALTVPEGSYGDSGMNLANGANTLIISGPVGEYIFAVHASLKSAALRYRWTKSKGVLS